MPGQTDDEVTIVPLAPDPAAVLPPGLAFSGNVYRFSAVYRPGGRPVTRLVKSSEVILIYPAEAGRHVSRTVVQSSDGTHWTALKTIDVRGQQQVTAGIHALGYFAAATPSSTPATSAPGGTTPGPPTGAPSTSGVPEAASGSGRRRGDGPADRRRDLRRAGPLRGGAA